MRTLSFLSLFHYLQDVSYSLHSFKMFLFVFGFPTLDVMFLGVSLFCIVYPELPRSMVWCLSLILESSQPLLYEIFLLLLSSSSVLQVCICYNFWNCPSFWIFPFCFLIPFFLFEFCLVQSTEEPSKVFFIPVTVFWFWTLLFNSFLEFTFLFILHICSCVLSTSSIKALLILNPYLIILKSMP